jgi:organic radical activating enzyme
MTLNNKQVPKPLTDRHQLEVCEIFPSIQGEGPFLGQPCVFIRLAGCNMQCEFCDTEYSTFSIMSVVDVLKRVCQLTLSTNLVVITGGEPFRQDISELVDELLSFGKRVQVETNGTIYRALPWEKELTIVCSPKAAPIEKRMLQRIQYYKFLVKMNLDGTPIVLGNEHFEGMIPKYCYLQPVDEQNKKTSKRNPTFQ